MIQMLAIDWANVMQRAAWTFVQGAISTFVALEVAMDIESIKSAAVATVVGGGAALLSFIKTFATEQLNRLQNEE